MEFPASTAGGVPGGRGGCTHDSESTLRLGLALTLALRSAPKGADRDTGEELALPGPAEDVAPANAVEGAACGAAAGT